MKFWFWKITAVVLLVSVVSLTTPFSARASIWGESIFKAMTFKEMLEEIYKKIQETLTATFKTQAIAMISGQLKGIMGGGSKGTGPIGNWQAFIYGSAKQYSQQQTSDFFKKMQSGTPAPLAQRIVSPAQGAVMSDPLAMKPDLQNYVREGRADMIFKPGWAQNPLVALNKTVAPQNDVSYMYLRGLALQQESFREKEEEKKAEGVAGAGYQSKKSGGSAENADSGKVTTPGSTQKDAVSQVQDMPLNRIASAQSVPDIVAAMATQMLTQMLKQGFAMVNAQISKGTASIKGQLGVGAGSIGNIQNMIMKGIK